MVSICFIILKYMKGIVFSFLGNFFYIKLIFYGKTHPTAFKAL